MKVGDLVVPAYAPGRGISVHELMRPTFSSRGRSREWMPDEPALVVGLSVRSVNGIDVLKVQILLGGKSWWIGAGSVKQVTQ